VAGLEALQRRSSEIWEEYRGQLAAHPDAIELPQHLIENGWVRIATSADGVPIGFSVVIPRDRATHDLDGLFVEPNRVKRGIGTSLVQDVCERARAVGAEGLEVIAGPAQGFYEKVGFRVVEPVDTRFGPAVRMRRELAPPNTPHPPMPA
jgi:GNAT superfamily N-acetyltransferase